MKGLLAILGKPKDGADSSEEDEAPESKPSPKSKMVDEAVAAAKEGDWDAFGDALKACLGGY